jgi:Zn-dependent protease with chaperone function
MTGPTSSSSTAVVCVLLTLLYATLIFSALTTFASYLASTDLSLPQRQRHLNRAVIAATLVSLLVSFVSILVINQAVVGTANAPVRGILWFVVFVIPYYGVLVAVRPARARLRPDAHQVTGVSQVVLLIHQVIFLAVMVAVPAIVGGYGPFRIFLVVVSTAAALLVVQAIGAWVLVYALGASVIGPPLRWRLKTLAARSHAHIGEFRSYPVFGQGDTNALQVGLFGGSCQVLMSENLIATLSDSELDAVVAHELGHAKEHHLVLKVLAFALIWGSFEGAIHARAWTSSELLWLLLLPYAFIAMLIMVQGVLGIYLEQRADDFAAQLVGAEELASALEKLVALRGKAPRSSRLVAILGQHPGFKDRMARLKPGSSSKSPTWFRTTTVACGISLLFLGYFVVTTATQWHPNPSAVSLAEQIGLHQSDLTRTFVATSGPTITPGRTPPSLCTPISSRPWSASASSSVFSVPGTTGNSFFSTVVIFPSVSALGNGFARYSSTAFRTECLRPQYIKDTESHINRAVCHNAVVTSTMDTITHGLGANEVDRNFVGTVQCPGRPGFKVTIECSAAKVGSIFVSLFHETTGGPAITTRGVFSPGVRGPFAPLVQRAREFDHQGAL